MHIRPFDHVARLGGDEFSIIIVNTNEEQAYSIANRICESISQIPVEYDNPSLQVSVSVGITTVQPTDADLKLILERTDQTLYRAKRQGRNCVVID